MQPTEEQIRQLMTSVSCAVCGTTYEPASIEVLGHRGDLWFIRVNCASCTSSGLVAALVKTGDGVVGAVEASERSPEPPAGPDLDKAPAPGPIGRADVLGMRRFLSSFDGDFQALFGRHDGGRSHRSAA
jgi:hypothetical protein